MGLLEMLDEEIEIAKRGMKIWYEEEFAQIEAQHKKELYIKDLELDMKDAEIRMYESQYKKHLAEKDELHSIELAEKDELHSIELAEKDKKIAELNAVIQANYII